MLAAIACTHPPPRATGLSLIGRGELSVAAGELRTSADGALHVDCDGLRVDVGRASRSEIELRFAYLGPTEHTQPLASGELRRQIGVRLRAQDTCNLVYVMWHIEPTPGIYVSVKHNPGLHTHAACGDRGYTNVPPTWSQTPAPIVAGAWHTLRARLHGRVLEVHADDRATWRAELPSAAFAFDGPVGMRTDNGRFDVQLLTSQPETTARALP